MRQEEYKALVQAAREADLVAYFQRNGFTVERKGSEYYVKEYPSLCTKPSTNQWYFRYTREGATNNSINCLTKVLGMDFTANRSNRLLQGGCTDVIKEKSRSDRCFHSP